MKKALNTILLSIIATGIIGTFSVSYKVFEHIVIKQPNKDAKQDTNIVYLAKEVRRDNKVNIEKNKEVNKRLDKSHDFGRTAVVMLDKITVKLGDHDKLFQQLARTNKDLKNAIEILAPPEDLINGDLLIVPNSINYYDVSPAYLTDTIPNLKNTVNEF